MARRMVAVFGVAVLVFAVAAFYAIAAESAPKETKETKAAVTPAAEPTPARAPATPEEMIARSEERMKSAGMSEGAIMRNRQMQTARFAANEPIGLLALKDQLKLTAEQAKKIEDIAAAARTQAEAVLTKEQVEMVGKMKGTPDTMLSLQAEIRSKMPSRRGPRPE